MRRRDFIKAIAGSATVRPLAVRAQQADRVPLIGVLVGGNRDNSATDVRFWG